MRGHIQYDRIRWHHRCEFFFHSCTSNRKWKLNGVGELKKGWTTSHEPWDWYKESFGFVVLLYHISFVKTILKSRQSPTLLIHTHNCSASKQKISGRLSLCHFLVVFNIGLNRRGGERKGFSRLYPKPLIFSSCHRVWNTRNKICIYVIGLNVQRI